MRWLVQMFLALFSRTEDTKESLYGGSNFGGMGACGVNVDYSIEDVPQKRGLDLLKPKAKR